MLQQTQVERVEQKYARWVARWPDWRTLARASNREVLKLWSGLGYNRRALYLKKLAQTVVDEFDGRLPADRETLCTLPGIGPYTADAILVFAFGKRVAAVDTNVRKVILHELGLPAATPAKRIEDLATQLLPRRHVRDWHHAIMDYARLALRQVPTRVRGRSHATRFQGSMRQLRGIIIRELTGKSRVRITTVAREAGRTQSDVRRAALGLQKDGLVRVSRCEIRLV